MTPQARRAGLAALVAAALLESCGTFATQGVIEGSAASCAAVGHPSTTLPKLTIKVLVGVSGASTATTTIASGAHFSFKLSPGHYFVTSGYAKRRVLLHAGSVQQVDLTPICPTS